MSFAIMLTITLNTLGEPFRRFPFIFERKTMLTDQDIKTAIDALLEFIADKSGPSHNNPYNYDLTALKRVIDNLTENLTEPNLTETE